MFDRRRLIAGAGSALVLARPASGQAAPGPFAALEARHGGRLGVFALEAKSGRSLSHCADERFLMCSTFKLLAVAAVLSRVDAGRESLARPIAFGRRDLVEPFPITGANVDRGEMPVEALCAAAAELSDSTAANLLMSSLGGPSALTAYLRSLGDNTTRVDRYEFAANTASGVLDTTSPRAMALTAQKILLGDALRPASRERLRRWVINAKPGLARIRAGLPAGWIAGDRPGTSRTETNDVAVIWPPNGRSPVVVAAYYDAPSVEGREREQVLRSVGEAVADWAA